MRVILQIDNLHVLLYNGLSMKFTRSEFTNRKIAEYINAKVSVTDSQ